MPFKVFFLVIMTARKWGRSSEFFFFFFKEKKKERKTKSKKKFFPSTKISKIFFPLFEIFMRGEFSFFWIQKKVFRMFWDFLENFSCQKILLPFQSKKFKKKRFLVFHYFDKIGISDFFGSLLLNWVKKKRTREKISLEGRA